MGWLVLLLMSMIFCSVAWDVLYANYFAPAGQKIDSIKAQSRFKERERRGQTTLDGAWIVYIADKKTACTIEFTERGWSPRIEDRTDPQAWRRLESARRSLRLRPAGIPVTSTGTSSFFFEGDLLYLTGGRYAPLSDSTIFNDDTHPSTPALWDYQSVWKVVKGNPGFILVFQDSKGYGDERMKDESIAAEHAAPKEPQKGFRLILKPASRDSE